VSFAHGIGKKGMNKPKKIIGSTNISCNFASVNLIVCTISMTKESWAYANFIKIFIAVNIGTM
jgi:hypothetical protein